MAEYIIRKKELFLEVLRYGRHYNSLYLHLYSG